MITKNNYGGEKKTSVRDEDEMRTKKEENGANIMKRTTEERRRGVNSPKAE